MSSDQRVPDISSNEVYTNTYISIGVERTSFPTNLPDEKQPRGTGSNKKTRDETKSNGSSKKIGKKRNAKVTYKLSSKKFIRNNKNNRLSCYNGWRHVESENPLYMPQRPLQWKANYPELKIKNSGLVVKKENFDDESENFDVKSEEFESVQHQLNQQYNNIEELESGSESDHSLRTNWERQIQKGYEND